MIEHSEPRAAPVVARVRAAAERGGDAANLAPQADAEAYRRLFGDTPAQTLCR